MTIATATPPLAEAGPAQPVRSDAHVALELRDSGGIQLELQSRVAPYYGDSLRAQVHEVLRQLGIQHARIQVSDEGALPFVIAARIEAAARRANPKVGRALPAALPLPPPSARDRSRRSRLYLPGVEPKFFINAHLHGPDAVILDLEDSVHLAEKDAACLLVRNALLAVDFGGCERMVRINQLPAGLADLDQVVPSQPDLVLIPKTEHPSDVLDVDRHIRKLQNESKDGRPIWLMPILETALGIEHAYAIAGASPRVAAVTIGLEDYTADLGVAKSREGTETLWARSRLLNACKAARVQAIDSVYGDIGDLEGLEHWALASRALGFDGMGCVHPSQIAVVHRAFAPTAAELQKAQAIVAAWEEAQAQGRAVVSLNSRMIDPPVVLRAINLVERARRAGMLEKKEQA